jgi:hypothetical protein
VLLPNCSCKLDAVSIFDVRQIFDLINDKDITSPDFASQKGARRSVGVASAEEKCAI